MSRYLRIKALLGVLALCLLFPAGAAAQLTDQPPYRSENASPSIPEDSAYPVLAAPGYFLADVVVSNSDPNLENRDAINDTEPSIAICPTAACVADPTKCEIVITAFSGRWYATVIDINAPLWHSTDGGNTWDKEFSITPPPYFIGGIPFALGAGCPCDQTVDYDHYSLLSASFLAGDPTDPTKPNIYSAATTDPADPDKWDWDVDLNGNTQTTNLHGNAVDQPWLVTGPGFFNFLFVGYDLFGRNPTQMQVSTSYSTDPPNFHGLNRDKQSGTYNGNCRNDGFGCKTNPGHRVASDPRNPDGLGTVYSLYQLDDGLLFAPGAAVAPRSVAIRYVLNASTDYGLTWRLTGDLTVPGGKCAVDNDHEDTDGCIVAKGESRQGGWQVFKFGGVNMLLGGVDALAVDPADGDVYVVYGNRVMDKDGTTRDHLMIGLFRLANNQLVRIGTDDDVTPGVQAALPAVAVAQNHTVGVLYQTYNGIVSGFPQFTAHLAQSTDFGQSFVDQPLVTSLSPEVDDGRGCPLLNCNPATIRRQRILGDFQQLKSLGNYFFGVFSANGAAFDRPLRNEDPVFVRAAALTP